jgi:hypothetical protein
MLSPLQQFFFCYFTIPFLKSQSAWMASKIGYAATTTSYSMITTTVFMLHMHQVKMELSLLTLHI